MYGVLLSQTYYPGTFPVCPRTPTMSDPQVCGVPVYG